MTDWKAVGQKVRGWAPIAMVLLYTLFWSTYRLSESPKTWYDEGMFMQVARNLSFGQGYVFRISPTQLVPAGIYTTVGYPVIYAVRAAFDLLGIGILQARLVMVPFMLLVVGLTYLYARRSWGKWQATLAALLVATHAPLYGNGKNVLGEVPATAFFFLFLCLLTKLQSTNWKGKTWWTLAGLSAGLFCATKPNFMSFGVVLFLVAIWKWRELKLHWQEALCASIAFIVPVIAFFVTGFGVDPRVWFSTFHEYASLPGLKDIAGATGMPLMLMNAKRFFTESSPVLLTVTMGTWFLSIIWRLWQRRAIPVPEAAAALMAGVTVAYFLRMPPFYRYLLPAQLLTYAHLPMATDELANALAKRFGRKFLFETVFVVLLCAICIYQAYQVAFDSWAQKYYTGTKTAELNEFISSLTPGESVFAYQALDVAALMPSENYYQYFPVALTRTSVGASSLDALKQGIPDVVVVDTDLLDQAKPYLNGYMPTEELPAAGYQIFERTP